MAKDKKISLRVSNTFRGESTKRGFINELDENGRWIPSNNIRIVIDKDALELGEMPSRLTVAQIQNLSKQNDKLVFVADVDYVKFSDIALDEQTDKDTGEVKYPASHAYFYKPEKLPTVLPASDILV
tara:strand:+ start:752 stop:1132 length:381 start_codon:yes stop_codon:yes gene_type:complete